VKKEFHISRLDKGVRLDRFISLRVPELSRTKIGKMIEGGSILVNGERKKPSYPLKEKDLITVFFRQTETPLLKPYPLDIDIVYEDEDIIVVNKPANLVVHPPSLACQNTLVNALIYMKKELSSVNPERPGVVHRLDKETTGIMVLAKNNLSHLKLIESFRERKVKKEYHAIVWGVIKRDRLSVDLPLRRDNRNRLKMKVSMFRAKSAITHIEVIKRFKRFSYIRIVILTGRMHQIRVHMNFLGHPILGDKKYGRKDSYDNLFLHSFRLGIYHPGTDKFMEFKAPLPLWFNDIIEKDG